MDLVKQPQKLSHLLGKSMKKPQKKRHLSGYLAGKNVKVSEFDGQSLSQKLGS